MKHFFRQPGFLPTLVLIAVFLAACNLSAPLQPNNPPPSPSPVPSNPPQLPTDTPAPSPTFTASPSPSATATETPPPTDTPQPTLTPTYAILRGKVNVDKVSCRYGPGAMYLYVYGMVKGATQDIIGRNDTATWLLTRSRGDDLSCWVKTDLMDINGDPMSVAPVHPDDYNLPKSPFYGPLTNVSAQRKDNQVVVSWSPLILRAGDDSLQTPYVLQVWVCRSGQIIMESLGSYETIINIVDEPGCSEASHGRITSAEKHGYTKFVEIPWP